MQYIDQSYKDLRLTLTSSINLDHFSLLRSKTIKLEGLTLTLYIIGESHIIHYQSKYQSFYEIFACQCIENDDILLSSTLDELMQNSLDLPNYKYSFALCVLSEAQEEQNTYDHSLTFTFPKNSVTSIGVKLQNKHIAIKTLHSYLNEQKYIYTSQKIQYKD